MGFESGPQHVLMIAESSIKSLMQGVIRETGTADTCHQYQSMHTLAVVSPECNTHVNYDMPISGLAWAISSVLIAVGSFVIIFIFISNAPCTSVMAGLVYGGK